MAENRTRMLVEAALTELYQPYGENVTDEVLEIIERARTLLDDYHEIAEGLAGGTGQLNQDIGRCVKEITGRKVLSDGNPCKRNELALTYSKLIVGRE